MLMLKSVYFSRGGSGAVGVCDGFPLNPQDRLKRSERNQDHGELKRYDDNSSELIRTRRHILFTGAVFLASVQRCNAGEVGARITKAVTTSDLGVSVRTQVVQGARVMDKVDGYWEELSDKFGLGSSRLKGQDRQTKVIPEPKSLDVDTARKFLVISDETFLSNTGISSSSLEFQIDKVAKLVKPSFERVGISVGDSLSFEDGRQFDFACYVHFKAYSDLLLESKINFRSFLSNFEVDVGKKVVSLLLPGFSKKQTSAPSNDQRRITREALENVERMCSILVDKGFVALVERSYIEDDDFEDWLKDMCELKFGIALDGDVTQPSQILLQEQGFRLYPNFLRFSLAYLMQQDGQQLSLIDYYFDTDYNSNPDKFEVKEVLINVVLESE